MTKLWDIAQHKCVEDVSREAEAPKSSGSQIVRYHNKILSVKT